VFCTMGEGTPHEFESVLDQWTRHYETIKVDCDSQAVEPPHFFCRLCSFGCVQRAGLVQHLLKTHRDAVLRSMLSKQAEDLERHSDKENEHPTCGEGRGEGVSAVEGEADCARMKEWIARIIRDGPMTWIVSHHSSRLNESVLVIPEPVPAMSGALRTEGLSLSEYPSKNFTASAKRVTHATSSAFSAAKKRKVEC